MSHEQNRELIQALAKCAFECHHCAMACLDEKDVKMLSRCIRLDLDCAAICELAIGFISRGSEHAQHILEECAEICEDCAEECEKHSYMDHCRLCSEICRECADSCRTGIAA